MNRTIFAAATVTAALALSACQPDAPAPAPAENSANAAAEVNVTGNATGENVTETVLNMAEPQRNIVFVRALIDAGLPCEGVEKSVRLDDMDGLPLWRAECKGGIAHMITITPDGTAQIVSRTSNR